MIFSVCNCKYKNTESRIKQFGGFGEGVRG